MPISPLRPDLPHFGGSRQLKEPPSQREKWLQKLAPKPPSSDHRPRSPKITMNPLLLVSLLGLFGLGGSFTGFRHGASSPINTTQIAIAESVSGVNHQLEAEQLLVNSNHRDDIHKNTVNLYCESLEHIGKLILEHPDKNPTPDLVNLFNARGQLSPEDIAFCESIVQEVQENGYANNGAYYFNNPKEYTMENVFDRFADQVLYPQALKTYDQDEAKARQTIEAFKKETRQFYQDSRAFTIQQALLIMTMSASWVALMFGGGGYLIDRAAR